MIELDVKADGVANLQRLIAVESAATRKALVSAIRGEAFSMRQTLRQNIIMGAPAPGEPFRPLSWIARSVKRIRSGGFRAPFPLRRLAAAVTYQWDDAGLTARVGFTARSAYWARRAAERQQTGFSSRVTDRMRQHFRHVGAGRLFGRLMRGQTMEQQDWQRRVLFLRGKTTYLKTPARPIVDPFWRHARGQVVSAIRKNFREKLAGRTFAAGVMERYAVGTTRDFWEQ